MNMDDNGSGGRLGAETVYGTHEDPHVVMSEKVQSLAGSIYQEFERMIARYDEDVVKSLMPLLVNVLECLDAAYQSNQEHDVELELLREDNEQLVTQYEREKSARKQSEQKLLEIEDINEAEKKELTGRLEALESIVRMLELKHKNSLEHASRLEERENDLKKEYTKLHERYTEVFKNHVDYMERTKLLLGSTADRTDNRNRVGSLHPMSRSSGPISFGFSCLESGVSGLENSESLGGSPVSASPSPPSPPIGDELAAIRTMEQAHQTDAVNRQSQATSPVTPQQNASKTTPKNKFNTLYQEFSFHDNDSTLNEGDESGDITGSLVHPADYASSVNDNYFGMGKEVENLILENNELLAMKNALNVVKDDLIVKVDELTGEQQILREEVASLSMARERLREHVTVLEEELRKIKEEGLAGNKNKGDSSGDQEESDVPMAQRKKFTRVEMARVLLERNQYKERFMELQDAVRLTQIIQANRNDTMYKKQSMFNFFSKLFSHGNRPQRPLSTQLRPTSSPSHTSRMQHSRTHADLLETTSHHSDKAHQRKKIEWRDQFRQVRAHVRKEDGRMHAYGWSLPGKINKPQTNPTGTSSGVRVPVPIFCRPLTETNPGMDFWCGTGVNMTGSEGQAGLHLSLASELQGATMSSENPSEDHRPWEQPTPKGLSSLVWICSTTDSNSTVTVIDANSPADILDSFTVCNNHLLCISSITGVTPDPEYSSPPEWQTPDIPDHHNTANTKTDGNQTDLGKIQFVTVDPESLKKIDESNTNNNDNGNTGNTENIESGDAIAESPSEEPNQNNLINNELQSITTAMPTMWLGARSGMLYIHSAIQDWKVCRGRVQFKDAILNIVQCKTRVVIALADGKVAVFYRKSTGEWDLEHYHIITLGDPQYSVRCLASVGNMVWCGYRSKIYVLEPNSLTIEHCLDAHPRKESQVRLLAPQGDGVWVSIRLDSTLRLYHAHTYQHLQDVDIEPYVSKMLGTGKIGFSFVRITALIISSGRLWIGTGNGVIISVPLSDSGANTTNSNATAIQLRGQSISALPGSTVRINNMNGKSIPYCSMAHAQLSFHGHRDAVKFFIAVPGSNSLTNNNQAITNDVSPPSPPIEPIAPPPMLVMSGGVGYIDFRIADGDMEDSVVLSAGETIEGDAATESIQEVKVEKSHLIVWQVASC